MLVVDVIAISVQIAEIQVVCCFLISYHFSMVSMNVLHFLKIFEHEHLRSKDQCHSYPSSVPRVKGKDKSFVGLYSVGYPVQTVEQFS